MNTVRRPGSLLTSTRPAHRLRQLLDEREPEPGADRPLAPVARVEVEALEGALAVSGASPGPVSSTWTRPGAVTTRTSPPGGVSRSAFSTRLETTWSTRSASAVAGAGPSATTRQRDVEGLGLRLVAADRVLGDLGEVDVASGGR